MKKLVLLLLCCFLFACAKEKETVKIETPYQKVIVDKLSVEPLPQWLLFYSSSNGNEMRKRVVEPKSIELILDSITQYNYPSETNVECNSDEGVKMFYADGRFANITFSKACSSTNLFNKKSTFEDYEAYQKLVSDIKTEEFMFASNSVIKDLIDFDSNNERILADCVGETCNEYTEKGKEEKLLRNFLIDLSILDETEKPEAGNTFIFEFLESDNEEPQQFTFYENEDEIVLGYDEQYYEVKTTYLSIRELLSLMDKKEIDNPSLNGSSFFEEGVGHQLEQAGFTYEENIFTSNPYNMETTSIDIDKGLIGFGKEPIYFDYLKNVSDTSELHGSQCLYSLSAQTSRECTLEEAKEEYQLLIDKMDDFTMITKVSMEELKTFTIQQRNIEKMSDNQFGIIDSEKLWLGNVIDVGAMLLADGFSAEGSQLVKNFEDKVLRFNPQNFSIYYGNAQEGSTYFINSSVGELIRNTTVCDFDYDADVVIGEECGSDEQYYFEEVDAEAQRVYYALLNRYSLTNDEVILYSKMIQASK